MNIAHINNPLERGGEHDRDNAIEAGVMVEPVTHLHP